jgi:hypothetical protein
VSRLGEITAIAPGRPDCVGKLAKSFRKFPPGLPKISEKNQFPSDYFQKVHRETLTYQSFATGFAPENFKNFS